MFQVRVILYPDGEVRVLTGGEAQVTILRVAKDPEQLAAPAAEPLQPEGEGEGGAEERARPGEAKIGEHTYAIAGSFLHKRGPDTWETIGRLDQLAAKEEPGPRVLTIPMFDKNMHAFQGPLRESREAAAEDMARWRSTERRSDEPRAGEHCTAPVYCVDSYFRYFRIRNNFLQRRDADALCWENVGRLDQLVAKEQPVAAGAPLGGTSDEELEKRLFELNKDGASFIEGGTYWHITFVGRLAREAVAAERERCAGIVDGNCRNTYDIRVILDKIRSGG